MTILTPLQAVIAHVEKKISKEDLLLLKKEIIQAYAEGFYDGHKKPTAKIIQKAVLSSRAYRNLDPDEQLEEWLKEQAE